MTGAEWLAIAAVLTGLILGLPVLRRVTIRIGASAEASRKSVHFTMGLVGASFPWIFDRPLPVWALAGLATAFLILLRWIPALRWDSPEPPLRRL
ncbi:MAG TPA: hypothetical protein VMN36_09705 [Verrucomicrobiales bacterium]|nr:hypothetical protein [Verrucomicrobiales bacterium]